MITRIVLADDHQMFREALCHLLQSQPDLEVVGQAGDGLDLLALARRCVPDIVCMDIQMPGMNGIDVTRALLAVLPRVKVVALSAYADQRYVLDMLNAGASAYVTKAEASDELLRAIRTVMRGRTYLCSDVTTTVIGAVPGSSYAHSALPHPLAGLGPRERQVLKLVADGQTSLQIGALLFIAASTVDVHRRNIMRKLNLHNVADLTRYAMNAEHDS